MVAESSVRSVLLHHDCHLLRTIASFLPSVVDVYNLFSLTKSICFCSTSEKDARVAMLRRTFIANLSRFLIPFGVSPYAFLTALSEDGASISGGFALACVTGRIFGLSGDIDVYRHAEISPHNATPALLLNSEYSLREVLPNLEVPDAYVETVGGNGVKLIVKTFEHSGMKKSIQLITLVYRGEPLSAADAEVNPSSRHLDNFDLTPCCVNLSVDRDGAHLHWHMPFLSDIVRGIMGPSLRLLSLANAPMNNMLRLTIERVMKYAQRGYCPTAELEELFVSVCQSYRVEPMRWFFARATLLSLCSDVL